MEKMDKETKLGMVMITVFMVVMYVGMWVFSVMAGY